MYSTGIPDISGSTDLSKDAKKDQFKNARCAAIFSGLLLLLCLWAASIITRPLSGSSNALPATITAASLPSGWFGS